MNFTPASPASLIAFVAIVVVVAGALIGAIAHAYRSPKAGLLAALGLAVWLGAQAALVQSGRMASLPLNGLPSFFVPILAIWTTLALSPVGRRIATATPLALLVGFQAFRLPLELVLHSWARQGTIPGAMTWTGQNWDIVSGVTALICAPLASRSPVAARITNVIGFALLLNVMRVAILSSPVPFGWGIQPPLLLAFHLPYAFIGPVCVGGALFGHLVLTRALWARPLKVEG
jgi:hypothetical protein